MDNSKKHNTSIVIIILLLLLLFNSYRNSSKISNLVYSQQELSMSLNNQITILNNDFSNLKDDMIQSVSDLQSYSFTYKGYDNKKDTVKLNFTFSLKQIHTNAKYYISYSPADQNNFKEVIANNISGTSFENLLNLSTEYNYNFKIIEKNENGTVKQLNNEDIINDVYNLYGNRTQLHALEMNESDSNLMYFILFTNNTLGIKENEIKSVILSLYYQDKIVYSEDITNKNISRIIPADEDNVTSENSVSENAVAEIVSDNNVNQSTTIINKDALQEYNCHIDISKHDLQQNYPEIFRGVKDYKAILSHKLIIELQNGNKIEF